LRRRKQQRHGGDRGEGHDFKLPGVQLQGKPLLLLALVLTIEDPQHFSHVAPSRKLLCSWPSLYSLTDTANATPHYVTRPDHRLGGSLPPALRSALLCRQGGLGCICCVWCNVVRFLLGLDEVVGHAVQVFRNVFHHVFKEGVEASLTVPRAALQIEGRHHPRTSAATT